MSEWDEYDNWHGPDAWAATWGRVADIIKSSDPDDFVFPVGEPTEFCAHETHDSAALPAHPYDEDGYCCWCGNGKWKYHAPWCTWMDAIERCSK